MYFIIIIIIVSGVYHECENKKHNVIIFQEYLIITYRDKILATSLEPTLHVVCVVKYFQSALNLLCIGFSHLEE